MHTDGVVYTGGVTHTGARGGTNTGAGGATTTGTGSGMPKPKLNRTPACEALTAPSNTADNSNSFFIYKNRREQVDSI